MLSKELVNAMLSKDDERLVDVLKKAMVTIDRLIEATPEGSAE